MAPYHWGQRVSLVSRQLPPFRFLNLHQRHGDLLRRAVHALQHASFLLGALLYWWSVMGHAPQRQRGAALASLFTTMIHTGALGALLTLSPVAWYPAWYQSAQRGR